MNGKLKKILQTLLQINEEKENHKIIRTEGSWGTGKSNLIKQNEQVIEILNTNIDIILKIFNCAEPNIKEAYEEKLITAKNTLSNSKIELLCNKLNIGLSH